MGVYVVDVGGASLKHGAATAATYSVTDNYVRMTAKAHAIQIRRPVERGYVVNWTLQGDLLQEILPPGRDNTFLVTTPVFTPEKLLAAQDEVAFEEFQYDTYASVIPQAVVPREPVACVVDLGFSCTYIVPVIEGVAQLEAVRRLNVGGKLMTNYLKECVSYRQWNMMDSFELIDEVKQAVCRCAMDFPAQMRAFADKSATVLQWALPDFVHTKRGPERAAARYDTGIAASALIWSDFATAVEQITVPEVLFHPSDIGLDQAGLAEGIADAIAACPEYSQGLMYQNIQLIGGTSQLPQLLERLSQELRPLVPGHFALGISRATDPIGAVWNGCKTFATTEQFAQHLVTKAEYLEHGSNLCRDRFQQYR
ncbi:actin-related protein 6-like [Achlya hypogyna]|uniref:Actin-related protein 6-like n=1 Tax=Achlya hypogyna TaxID=1202772 RepID=A0A1V9ZFS7_ACHHY|nr:actin-related protein 6-like [Achlya hypogyna]